MAVRWDVGEVVVFRRSRRRKRLPAHRHLNPRRRRNPSAKATGIGIGTIALLGAGAFFLLSPAGRQTIAAMTGGTTRAPLQPLAPGEQPSMWERAAAQTAAGIAPTLAGSLSSWIGSMLRSSGPTLVSSAGAATGTAMRLLGDEGIAAPELALDYDPASAWETPLDFGQELAWDEFASGFDSAAYVWDEPMVWDMEFPALAFEAPAVDVGDWGAYL